MAISNKYLDDVEAVRQPVAHDILKVVEKVVDRTRHVVPHRVLVVSRGRVAARGLDSVPCHRSPPKRRGARDELDCIN